VPLDARQKLFYLRYAVAKAAAASQTLVQWLDARVITAGDAGVSGKTLVGASAGGTSSSYSVGGGGGATPDSLAQLWDELLELYTICDAALLAANGSAPNQAAIVAEMRFRLSPVESAVADHSQEWVGNAVTSPT
jgi:hypothetical protein